MPQVVEPVHVGPAVVEGMDELVCDHPVHVGLLLDVVLTQNDLQTKKHLIILEQQTLNMIRTSSLLVRTSPT